MRLTPGWILVFATVGFSVARAEQPPLAPAILSGRPPLLAAAFDAFLDGQQRWAYTESFIQVGRDNPTYHVWDMRVDPSQPYAQQFVPLQVAYHAPTEKIIKAWAKHGEQLAKRRHAVREELAAAQREADFQIQLFTESVTPVLDRASVVSEDETTVTYAIPLRQPGGPDAPAFDTFELTARVNKATRQFVSATFRQRSAMRVIAAKYYDGLIVVEFGTPDPQFPAIPVKISRRFTTKPLFGKAYTLRNESVRTDLRHVTPYDERFKVNLAPLKFLEL